MNGKLLFVATVAVALLGSLALVNEAIADVASTRLTGASAWVTVQTLAQRPVER